MAKLTTRELEVVTNSIYKKVEDKKEQFKTTKDYSHIAEQVKIQLKYHEILPLVQEYKPINEEINRLNSRKNGITSEIRVIMGAMAAIPYDEQSLNNIANNAITKEVNKLYPTRKDIESDIILLSVSGSNDIINAIISKYKLS